MTVAPARAARPLEADVLALELEGLPAWIRNASGARNSAVSRAPTPQELSTSTMLQSRPFRF